ncbi:MAG: nucleotidyltransferase [Deltaproteobacteria bacterium]|nr:nucleotidyltransferase [Deltaproteobacteria bacterium]
MAKHANIDISQRTIETFCKKYHVRKLALFGSVLREDFNQKSDVDVLVEFEAGQVVGFIRLAAMELELSGLLGYKVDLRTPGELSRYFRKDVLDSAEVRYAQG